MWIALIFTALLAGAEPPGEQADYDALVGPEAEEFLRTAEIIDRENIPVGVTDPQRLTLTDGTHTARAVWKTIDEYRPIKRFYDGGPPELGFRDSYKNEIAAYELDKVLGFGFVPTTVARELRRTEGSVQMWIEGCITEGARRRQELEPADPLEWARQVYDVRLFHQLIYDADYENLSNILVDEDFRQWSVDHSRAFRTQGRLMNADYLRRFSRRHLDSLRTLTPEVLEEKLGAWLSAGQRQGLLERRDLILEHVERLITEQGERAVLF